MEKQSKEFRLKLKDLCDTYDYDPFEAMIIMCHTKVDVTDALTGEVTTQPLLRPMEQIAVHKEIAQYLAPKLKALEIQVDPEAQRVIFNMNMGEKAKVIEGEVIN